MSITSLLGGRRAGKTLLAGSPLGVFVRLLPPYAGNGLFRSSASTWRLGFVPICVMPRTLCIDVSPLEQQVLLG